MRYALLIMVFTAFLLFSAIFAVQVQDSPRVTKNTINRGFSNVQVSQDSPAANEIFLSRSKSGVFYMGWNDYRTVSWSNGYVHLGFSYSTDGGKTWSTNQVLGNTTDGDFHDAAGDPVVVPGDGDDVYYFLMEFNSSEAKQNSLKHSQLVVKKSVNHGETWVDEVRLWPYDVDKPWAVYWNGNLYVAWDNVSSGYMEFTHTVNGNFNSWSPIKNIGPIMYPGMAINETGAIFVAGVYGGTFGGTLYVYVSLDGGNTFGSHNIASISSHAWENNPRSGPIPQVASQGKDVYVVWVDNESYSQVYLAESHDGGNTWSSREVGDLTGNYRYMYPSVSISPNGLVHITYYRMVDSTKDISVIYRNYTYQTGKFSPEVVVDSWTNSHSFIGDYSTIVADRFGNVSIGYTTENPGDNAMFATMSIPLKIESVTNSSQNGIIDSGEPLNVSAWITSADEIKNVQLFYRFDNETNYSMLNMTRISGNEFNGTWNATINTTGHSGKIYYFIHADDGIEKYENSEENSVVINAVPELWLPAIIALPAAIFVMRRKR